MYPALCFATILFAAGCGDKISNTNLRALNDELEDAEKHGGFVAPKEVESILGQPDAVETFEIPLETRKPTLPGVRYYYRQNGETLELHFVDGKLINSAAMWGAVKQSATNESTRNLSNP